MKKIVGIFGLLFTVLLFVVGCKGDKVESIYKPTNIVYDGSRISWDKVKLAEYYNIQINDGEKKRVNTNIYSYDAKGEEFDVTIYAVYNGSENGESMHFIPLDTVTDITISDSGELSWAEVVGATAYKVSVNGKVLDNEVTETYYMPEKGSNRIKIKAVVSGDNSYFSSWSEELQVYINNEPSGIKYDGEVLSWMGNTASYEVSINGEKQVVNGNSLVYNSQNQDFNVIVKALGNHETSFDSKEVTADFHYLQSITSIVLEDGILTWEEIPDAEGYEIRINGVIQKDKVLETSYADLAAGKSLEVEIRPFNNSGNYFSSWSSVKDVYILEAPSVSWNADLELDGDANNNLIWDAVNGAIGYQVEVEYDGNKEIFTFGEAERAFPYAYSGIGTYKVRVKALADETGDTSDSKYAKEIVIERLAAPKANTNNFIVSDRSNLAAGFIVNYQGVSGATSYQLYKDGVLLEGKNSTTLSITDNSVVDDSISAEQKLNYYIRSMGGVKTLNNITYVTLPCLTKDALSFEITIQAMPTDLTMSGFNAQWSSVAGSDGYTIKYAGQTLNATETSYSLETLKAGSYEVSVCARGNGGATLASNYTPALRVTRLEAPTDIKISYGAGNGQLDWKEVTNASGYQVFLDHSTEALGENAYSNMYQHIKTEGTVLHMIAVANRFNADKTEYFMTSEASPTQQFIRLEAPVFPEGFLFNQEELLWSPSANINTSEYTPTYQVYESNIMQTGGVQNGTRFSLLEYKGGNTYKFKVKAIGNDSKYLDSEFSKEITVYKLETPEIRVENNKFVWNGVANASSYVLEIDGVRVDNQDHISGKTYEYIPKFTEIKNYQVKLYALGDGYNNIKSDTYTRVQKVENCLAPEFSFYYTGETFISGGKVIVEITKEAPNCSSYQYEIGGQTITASELKCEKILDNTGKFTIRVKALGGTFDNNGIYYVDSKWAGGNSGYELTLLASPTHSSFKITSDGIISWAHITGSLGYEYQISYDKGTFSEIMTNSSISFQIKDFKNYQSITIKVRAKGNGNNIITSEWVTWTWDNASL